MFDEHTWTDALSVGDPESQETVGQLAVKDSRAIEAQRRLEQVLGRSMQAIANTTPYPGGTLAGVQLLELEPKWIGRDGLAGWLGADRPRHESDSTP